MTSNSLNQSNDFVIFGSGLTSSIIAGTLARAGLKGVQVEEHDFFGEEYSMFTLQQLKSRLDGDVITSIPEFEVHQCSINETIKSSPSHLRQHSLELHTAPTYSRGPLISTIMAAKLFNYISMQTVSPLYTLHNDQLVSPPTDKGALLKSRTLSPKIKRQIMKVSQSILNHAKVFHPTRLAAAPRDQAVAATDGYVALNSGGRAVEAALKTGGGFKGFLTAIGAPDPVVHRLLSAGLLLQPGEGPAEAEEGISAEQGYRRCLSAFSGMGRFSPGNYLICPQYGISDLPQAFIRVLAVSGGVCLLRNQLTAVEEAEAAPSSPEQPQLTLTLSEGHVITTPLVLVPRAPPARPQRKAYLYLKHRDTDDAALGRTTGNAPLSLPGAWGLMRRGDGRGAGPRGGWSITLTSADPHVSPAAAVVRLLTALGRKECDSSVGTASVGSQYFEDLQYYVEITTDSRLTSQSTLRDDLFPVADHPAIKRFDILSPGDPATWCSGPIAEAVRILVQIAREKTSGLPESLSPWSQWLMNYSVDWADSGVGAITKVTRGIFRFGVKQTARSAFDLAGLPQRFEELDLDQAIKDLEKTKDKAQ